MTYIKRFSIYVLTFMTVSFANMAVIASPVYAAVSADEQACKAIGGTYSGGDCETGGTSVSKVIDFAVNLLSVIVGIAAVIMIIIGGFKYVTSNGDSNNIASAKNTIIYAIVGLIVAALAQVIARFVLTSL